VINQDHPYNFLKALREKPQPIFQLSKYAYIADSLLDDRQHVSVNGPDFSDEWVNGQILSLRPDQEIAIHSTIQINGRSWHIPMIDFAVEDAISSTVFDRLRLFLPRAIAQNLAIYESGRSFHAYSTSLLSPKEWIGFMGRLLLVNPKGRKEIIDSRWIGHRLIGGYCSLRWSNNSGLYLGLPSRVKLQL
jgi:hypothetical protein